MHVCVHLLHHLLFLPATGAVSDPPTEFLQHPQSALSRLQQIHLTQCNTMW